MLNFESRDQETPEEIAAKRAKELAAVKEQLIDAMNRQIHAINNQAIDAARGLVGEIDQLSELWTQLKVSTDKDQKSGKEVVRNIMSSRNEEGSRSSQVAQRGKAAARLSSGKARQARQDRIRKDDADHEAPQGAKRPRVKV